VLTLAPVNICIILHAKIVYELQVSK